MVSSSPINFHPLSLGDSSDSLIGGVWRDHEWAGICYVSMMEKLSQGHLNCKFMYQFPKFLLGDKLQEKQDIQAEMGSQPNQKN